MPAEVAEAGLVAEVATFWAPEALSAEPAASELAALVPETAGLATLANSGMLAEAALAGDWAVTEAAAALAAVSALAPVAAVALVAAVVAVARRAAESKVPEVCAFSALV